MEKINIGVVGACRRGAAFKTALDTLDEVSVRAVCDIHAAGLDESAASLGASEKYVEYEEMLERAKIDAVLLATPMHLHAPQAIRALQQNLHVLSEVTAAISIDQCKDLVRAARASQGIYMLAENCNYFRHNVAVREMVRQGLFGIPYYAEGAYLHELKHNQHESHALKGASTFRVAHSRARDPRWGGGLGWPDVCMYLQNRLFLKDDAWLC